MRLGRRTKHLVKRLVPGDVAVIDHVNIDRIAAEELIATGVRVVINASPSSNGRYPNAGPLLLAQAGVRLIDVEDVDPFELLADGNRVTVAGGAVLGGGRELLRGRVLGVEELERQRDEQLERVDEALAEFAENTVAHVRQETDLLTGSVEFPPTRASFRDRHVLIVVRGDRHRRDLKALRAYIRDVRPLVVAVDGGADGVLEAGMKPDVILGDMDSAGDEALRCGAELIVHAYPDGRAPGRQRLLDLGLDHTLLPAAGTSEDVAMLMAYEKGATLIVSVGAHFNLIEFLDRKRGGMSSTFLTRLRIGEKLVDAKGVSRLYNPSSPVRAGGPLPRRLHGPAGDRRDHLAGAQRPGPAGLAEDQDLARPVAPRRPASSLPAADGLQRSIPRGLADRRLPRPRDRDPDRRRVRRRRADQHPQEPRAEPHRQPAGRARTGRRTERQTGPLRRIRQPRLPGAGAGPARRAGGSAWSRSATCRATRSPRSRKRSARPGRAWSASAWCASRSTSAASAASSRKPASPTSAATKKRWRNSAPGVGRQLVRGGTLLDRVRSHLFSRASGNFGALDGVIVVRQTPEEMGAVQRAKASTLESALMAGITGTRTPAVGVETSTAEPSSVSFFAGNDLSSVDDVETTAGTGGDGLRPARRRGQLRRQGLGRPPAARPAAAGRIALT